MLIGEAYVQILFQLIANFVTLDSKKATERLNRVNCEIKEDNLVFEDYLHPIVFSTESQVKNEGVKKKCNKFNTICK